MRAVDPVVRQTWDAIGLSSWVTVAMVQGAADNAAPTLFQASSSQAPPANPAAPSVAPVTGPASVVRLFDVYMFIDWSATNGRATAPGPDQLWLGEMLAGSQPTEQWFPARRDCAYYVEQRLLQHADALRRVLVGFDFPYGYPAGLVEAAGLPAPAGKWLAIWTALAALMNDDDQNRSNRFEVAAALNAMMTPPRPGTAPGPFWNTPAPGPLLTAASPAFPYTTRNNVSLSAWRIAERRLQQAGTHPHSAFKLFTAGSVGSQALTGIPVVHFLRYHPLLCNLSLVWPFETGFTATIALGRRPFILHAEIWPGVVQHEAQRLRVADPPLIKDRAQVRAMCLWADAQDAAGALGPLFAPPADVPLADLERCVNEEGWVLGAR